MKRLLRDTGGYSLVEMMIAIFILTYAILGLASITITAMQANLQNELRNTAILLTTETAENALAQSIDTLVTSPPETRLVNVRGSSTRFTINRTVTNLTTDLRQVDIQVSWTFRNSDMTNNAVIYKHRAM